MKSRVYKYGYPTEWLTWWAWYPVNVWVTDGKTYRKVWLEDVERRIVIFGTDDAWEYREKN